MRICELKQKEIINTCTCKSLGCATDVEFDCCSSRLTALVVPGHESEYVIPWECIRQIGEDIILVEIQEDKCLRKQ